MLFCRLHRQKGLNVNLFSYEIRHGAGKPTSKVIEEVRDIYAFIGTPPLSPRARTLRSDDVCQETSARCKQWGRAVAPTSSRGGLFLT